MKGESRFVQNGKSSRPLNGKGSDGGGTDVCLAIVDRAFNGEKFEWWRLPV
jgi:hypothetical protein